MVRDCIKLATALVACVGYYFDFLRERQALEREIELRRREGLKRDMEVYQRAESTLSALQPKD